MTPGFNAYELNPDIRAKIGTVCKDPNMADFIEWLLQWEGERLYFERVPSLDDITKRIDLLAEAAKQ